MFRNQDILTVHMVKENRIEQDVDHDASSGTSAQVETAANVLQGGCLNFSAFCQTISIHFTQTEKGLESLSRCSTEMCLYVH